MSLEDTANQRVIAGAAATLSFQGVDQYGEPADPGTVTVEITRADGTELVASGTATTGSGSSPRTYALTASQTAELDRLTAVWSVSSTAIAQTVIDVVGGVYVSQTQAAAMEPTLGTSGTSTAVFRTARSEVETMFEDSCRRAFVPRLTVEYLDGSGLSSLVLRYPQLRRVRWVLVDGEELDSDLVDAIPADPAGVAKLDGCWPRCRVTVGYEHGFQTPPADVVHAAVHAIRYQTNTFRAGITDRAISYQPIEGGNVVIATPGLGPWVTGIPAVDEVLKRYRWSRPVVA